MVYFLQVTDTFSGEANYSWVRNYRITASTMRGAIWKFSRDYGSGWRCVGDFGDTRRYDSTCGATCFFIDEWDDTHENFTVKEI